jgi:hypothetical protein
VVHPCNPSTQEAKASELKLEASLGYIVRPFCPKKKKIHNRISWLEAWLKWYSACLANSRHWVQNPSTSKRASEFPYELELKGCQSNNLMGTFFYGKDGTGFWTLDLALAMQVFHVSKVIIHTPIFSQHYMQQLKGKSTNPLMDEWVNKICIRAGCQRLMPVILATQKAGISRTVVWSQPRQNSSWDPILEKTFHKKGLMERLKV